MKKHFIKLKRWSQKIKMTKKRKKVLVLASTFPTFLEGDSTAPFVFELSKRLTNKFDVFVLAPYSSGTKMYQEKENLIIHRFKYWFGKNNLADGAILPNLKKNRLLFFQIPFFYLAQFFAIKKLYKKYDFDIIHAHWIFPQGLTAVLFKGFSTWKGTIVCTAHGGDIYSLRFLNNLKKWVINKCNDIAVVSEAIKQEILKLGVSNTSVEVIPMGVDSNRFNADKSDNSLRKKYNINGPLLLFVGRLSEKKGIEYLLKAMPGVIKHIPAAKLLVVGHGEREKKLKSMVNEQLNISENVVFTGGIPNTELPKYYASADMFIGPSIIAEDGDREGFPVSFMEAMACCTPIIISDLEIFSPYKHEKNALKTKEKSPTEIADSILRLIKDTNLQKTIVQNNTKLVETCFSAEVVGKKYINILMYN